MNQRLHIYHGYGKGKTTAALGLALRALGAGQKVAFVQFDKGADPGKEHYSERKSLRTLPGLSLFTYGLERVMGPQSFRVANEAGDFDQARAALQKSRELVASGEFFLVVLDEVLASVLCGLLNEKDVMDLLDLYDSNRRCELVLTGHKVWPALVERADLVTEMRKEKHYYDRQEPPKEGIEY
jgi:cob(I)alamin adenosyltransferase